ncbi:Exostosin family protein [Klebsormidium nitens]|uniref:Exostosin family protein n=1 Tax=Klebsormidium nitens TaxID=105231 RepID=A0A1Y1HP36_KLENI|nr:Exostosin family protein [Klebsormidium nitens]|eukprot:GAQ80390.1 Exostosin family protein [Klebsormidium nitens]
MTDPEGSAVREMGSGLFQQAWRLQKMNRVALTILIICTALFLALSFDSPSFSNVENAWKPWFSAGPEMLAAPLAHNCSCNSQEITPQPTPSAEIKLVERIVEKPVERIVVKSVERFVEKIVYETKPVRVYVYDLPSKFTTDFYAHLHATRTPHAAEWWIYLDIMGDPAERDNSVSVRVDTTEEADVFLVPFMASQSFNCYRQEHFLRHDFREICGDLYGKDDELQDELLAWLETQATWQRSGGIDHVILVVHPLAMNRIGYFLRPCVHLLTDFVFYTSDTASLEKDVVVPYSHLVERLPDDLVGPATSEANLAQADILLYFAGILERQGMGQVRNKLSEVLQGEEGVVINSREGQGALDDDTVAATAAEMRRSKFCLDPAGDTPSSARLFDAIVNLCIPVIISDDVEIPFEGQVNLRDACVFVTEADAVQPGVLVARLRAMPDEDVLRMRRQLPEVRTPSPSFLLESCS